VANNGANSVTEFPAT